MLIDTSEIINKLGQTAKGHLTNKSFYLGGVLAVGIFSQYIFGPDNLAEQIAEKIFNTTTGQNVDFSPEADQNTIKIQDNTAIEVK